MEIIQLFKKSISQTHDDFSIWGSLHSPVDEKSEMIKKYQDRFGFSTPDTRNMDTLAKQAAGLRSRAATDPEYVEFVARNMERIADEYADMYEKGNNARREMLDIQKRIDDFFGIVRNESN